MRIVNKKKIALILFVLILLGIFAFLLIDTIFLKQHQELQEENKNFAKVPTVNESTEQTVFNLDIDKYSDFEGKILKLYYDYMLTKSHYIYPENIEYLNLTKVKYLGYIEDKYVYMLFLNYKCKLSDKEYCIFISADQLEQKDYDNNDHVYLYLKKDNDNNFYVNNVNYEHGGTYTPCGEIYYNEHTNKKVEELFKNYIWNNYNIKDYKIENIEQISMFEFAEYVYEIKGTYICEENSNCLLGDNNKFDITLVINSKYEPQADGTCSYIHSLVRSDDHGLLN